MKKKKTNIKKQIGRNIVLMIPYGMYEQVYENKVVQYGKIAILCNYFNFIPFLAVNGSKHSDDKNEKFLYFVFVLKSNRINGINDKKKKKKQCTCE